MQTIGSHYFITAVTTETLIQQKPGKQVVKSLTNLLSVHCLLFTKPPIPLDGDSATIRNFGQNDTNRSRNGKSAIEAQ